MTNAVTVAQQEKFVPDTDISIDVGHSLDQMSSRYQTVRDGLPELVKNAKDHYLRLSVRTKEERQIVVLVSKDRSALGVLDFGGAGPDDFVGWKTWSSRTANRNYASPDIEGGHGNGGKSFMVRGCINRSAMCGYKDGKLNKHGFVNDDPNVKRYLPGHWLVNVNEKPEVALNKELSRFGFTIGTLPEPARNAFIKRKSFTLVNLEGVKDWEKLDKKEVGKLAKKIPADLQDHGQAALTIEICTVWVCLDESHVYGPLVFSDLTPLDGLENIPSLQIPETLTDPDTSREVKFSPDKRNVLVIKTSKNNLRLSDRQKAKNVVRVYNDRNNVANWSIAELAPSSSSGFIYAKITCVDLTTEFLSGTEWSQLADRPLARALKHWTAEKLVEIATKIQELRGANDSEADINRASDALSKLRDLMEKHLEKQSSGEGLVQGAGLGKNPRKPAVKWGNKIDKIILEPDMHIVKLAAGSTIPLVVKCYEKQQNVLVPVKKGKLKIFVDNSSVVCMDGTRSIYGKTEGITTVFFETEDGKVRSNSITVEVAAVDSLTITPITQILKQGEFIRLNIQPIVKNKIITDMVFEAHVDEANMGVIDRLGGFKAGGVEGNVTVRVRFGPKSKDIATAILTVGSEKVEPRKGSAGSGIPLILLCGQDAPGKEGLPESEATHSGGEDYPTIIDWDPIWDDDGIIWINPESKESKKLRSSARGSGRGLLSIHSKTFHQFLVLKCFEILKRLKVRQDTKDAQITSVEFVRNLSQAEMDTSGFLEEAYDLVEKLVEGEDNVESN